MTAPQKRTLTFTVYASVLGLLAWAAMTGAAKQLVLRPEYELHIQTKEAVVEELRGITLDHLCADHPTNRRCR